MNTCAHSRLNKKVILRFISQEPLGDTALHLAARARDGDLVKLFIEAGCNVDAANEQGQTVLHIAALNGDDSIIRLVRSRLTVGENRAFLSLFVSATCSSRGPTPR